jgi:putative tryptophan/tyrosine transport system permease protein
VIEGAFTDALQTGLPYSLAFLGVWMTFRLQGEFDLTVDNSFTLGAAVFGTWVFHGGSTLVGLPMAIAAGALAGLATYVVRSLLGISLILASIIVGTGLFSLNLEIMGEPNISLFGSANAVEWWVNTFAGGDMTWGTIEFFGLIALIGFGLVMAFLRTDLGLILRTNGLNRSVVRSNAGSPDFLLMLAVVCGNALVATSGALYAQQVGFVDISMGLGTLIAAATAILIGETLVRASGPTLRGVLAVLVGAVAYRFVLALAFRAGVDPTYFQGVTALIVIAILALRRGLGTAAGSHWLRRLLDSLRGPRPASVGVEGSMPLDREG